VKKSKLFIAFTITLVTVAIASTIIMKFRNDEKDDTFVLGELQLIQIDSYIALSSNDRSAYNRGLPFYFNVQTKGDSNTEKVEQALIETFSSVMIYSNSSGVLFETEVLIWGVGKQEPGLYNLTLFIIPDFHELIIDNKTKIDKIVFISNNEEIEHDLVNYIIETKETILEDVLYVASSTILTDINEDLYAVVCYGIFEKEAIVEGIELYYPVNFADISKHELIDEYKTEGDFEYLAYYFNIHFLSKNEKIVFRPFIQVKYDGKSGWVVPTVPAYIN